MIPRRTFRLVPVKVESTAVQLPIRAWVGIALIGVASVGCRGEAPIAPAGTRPTQPAATRPVAPAETQPTQAEAEVFGKAFAKHLSRCDPAALEGELDVDGVVARAVSGLQVSDAQIAEARKGLTGAAMCAGAMGETFTYLHTQVIDGKPQPMLRGLAGANGFNYLRLELTKRDGRVRAADEYYFSSGTWTSETIRIMIQVAATQSGPTLQRIGEANRAGKRKEARALLRSLPADLRTTKFMLTAELNMFDPSDPEYLVALDAFAKAFAGDPSMQFHEIDRNLLHKDLHGLLDAIARLDAVVGGDPYLDAVRALVFRTYGKFDAGIAAVKRATIAEPTLRDGWMMLATLQVATKDRAGALRTVEVLRDRFGMPTDADSLRANGLSELPDTPEYAAWSKR